MIMVDKMLNRPNMLILAHSMGSRLAIQIFKNVMKGRNETQKYNFVVAAGDIPVNLCQEFIAEHIKREDQFHVLFNPKDITLKLANFRKKYTRLGLVGLNSDNPNVVNHMIDKKKDEEIFLSSIFGHRYFYSSPSVREMIKDIFLDAVNHEIYRLGDPLVENMSSS
jgi:esterase/lipase superfamily enzyme